jgi:hypothetical protein
MKSSHQKWQKDPSMNWIAQAVIAGEYGRHAMTSTRMAGSLASGWRVLSSAWRLLILRYINFRGSRKIMMY